MAESRTGASISGLTDGTDLFNTLPGQTLSVRFAGKAIETEIAREEPCNSTLEKGFQNQAGQEWGLMGVPTRK